MLQVNLGEASSSPIRMYYLGRAVCLLDPGVLFWLDATVGLFLGSPCPQRIIAFGVPWFRGRDNPYQDFAAPRSGRSRSGPGDAGLLQPPPSIRLNS